MKFFMLTVCLFGTVFAALLGTWSTLSVDDPNVIKLADQAVADINAKDNSLYYNKLIQIKEAKSSGDGTYVLKVILRKTDCPKSGPYTDHDCQIKEDARPKECVVQLWLEPTGPNKDKKSIYICD